MKKKLIRIFKGLVFVLIAILLLQVIIYDVNFSVDYNGNVISIKDYHEYFSTETSDFIVKTSLNYILSGAFFLLGILEIGGAFINGN